MGKPSSALVFRMVAVQSIRETLRFPLWWYGEGLGETLGKLWRSIRGSVRYFGVDVWAKNLFVPMYGDTSLIGRLISFGVRLVMLSVRFLGVIVWTIIAFALAMIYLIVLPLAVLGLLRQLLALLF